MDKMIGQIAYEAYVAALAKPNAIPWADFKDPVKDAWGAAAVAVENCSIARVRELMDQVHAKEAELVQFRQQVSRAAPANQQTVEATSLTRAPLTVNHPVKVVR